MTSSTSDPGIRRSSSSLLALSALCLPSPPITPSVSIEVSLNGSNRYGEIPIIFDFLTTSSKSNEERTQRMQSLKVTLPPLAKFSPISAFFPMSDSTNSLNTFGSDIGLPSPASMTFHFAKENTSEGSRRSSALVASLDQLTTADLLPASASAPLVKVVDFDNGQQKIEDFSTFTISAYLSSSSNVFGKHSNNLLSQCGDDSATSFLSAKKADSVEDRTPTQPSFLKLQQKPSSDTGFIFDDKTPTRSTFRGVRKAADPRPTSILSTSDSGRASLSTMEFQNLSSSSREMMDDDITPTQSSFSTAKANALKRSPIRAEQASRNSAPTMISALNDDDRTPTQSSFLKGQGVIAQKGAIGTQHMSLTGHFNDPDDSSAVLRLNQGANEVIPNLQHAKWLRDAVVELWIDQEGFREIRPQFYLASVTNGLTDCTQEPVISLVSEKTDPIFTTVAEFLPSSRTAHFFHHATLDRAPTLTRVTVGGDQTKDYITRAATLSLRDNGVFFVDGTEDYRLEGDNGPTVRLNWRFEYFISSRKPDGRSAHRGEKQLTPLSFSCTPALLHPLRANKVKVFHIMRKTLMPKIVAHKLEPPELLPYPTHASEDPREAVGTSGTPLSSSESEAVLSSDIRASPTKPSIPTLKSGKNILAKATARMRKGSISEPPPLPTSRTSSFVSQAPTKMKPRRGSVGEADRTASDLKKTEAGRRLSHKRPKSLDLSKMIGKGERQPTSIAAPIVPYDELLKLLSKDPHPEIASRRVSARIQVVNNERVTVLPAPPRHK